MFLKSQRVNLSILVLLGLSLSGCVENSGPVSRPTPPPLLTEPIGIQLQRAEPRLAGMPFRVLLDFEQSTDFSFLSPEGLEASTSQAHTGRASLHISGGQTVSVKLGALVPGAFPDRWAVAGGYCRAAAGKGNQGAKVTIGYRTGGAATPVLQRTVEVSEGRWTPVFVDLTELKGAAGEAGVLTFSVEGNSHVYCDDVLLLNNIRTLSAPGAGAGAGSAWTIRESGFSTVVERAGHFRMALATPEASAEGWAIEEANDQRARFASASGKTWAIYLDGRQYQNGSFIGQTTLPEAAAIFTRQHNSPADLNVAEELGRVDRDTAGDKNNDGYNEQRGSYQLIAKGARFEVKIKPNTPMLAYPVLEIARLPAGNVLATVEGQLIETTIRLPNGNLLVIVPATLERATAVNIVVK